MLQETEYRIKNISSSLFDIDAIKPDFWVGVTDFSDDRQSLIINNNSIILPQKVRFPIVRFVNESFILVIDSRTDSGVKNGWIITSDGNVQTNFFAGDAIQDVVVTKNFFVITYFDESYGNFGIESERISIFDFDGNYLYGYMSQFNSDSVDIVDCYAAAFVKDTEIIFFSYTEFPLVIFDVEKKTQQIWQTPIEVAGSGSISKLGNKIYFHGPYKDKFGIYTWEIGSEKVEKIASYSSQLRGLSNGRFLAKGNSGYTIISLQ